MLRLLLHKITMCAVSVTFTCNVVYFLLLDPNVIGKRSFLFARTNVMK